MSKLECSTGRLADRLGRLRAQAGSPARNTVDPSSNPQVETAVPEDPARPGLEQRLRRVSPRRVQHRNTIDAPALAAQLRGELVADGLIEIRAEQPLRSRSNKRGKGLLPDGSVELPETQRLGPQDWVFMDTETTGLAGGTGTLVFLLGLARFDGEGIQTRQYLCTRISGERHMLRLGLEWCAGAALISYNGKSFDRPLLDTRCRMQRLEAVWHQREHLDLLHTVRRAFDRRWPDCRLQSAEQRLLGLRRDDDLPGAEAPAAWLAYLRTGDASRLRGVVRHNRQDLVSLAEMLPVLAEVHRHPPQWQADSLRIARAWRRAGRAERAIEVLEQGAGEPEDRHELASLYRRERNWPAARSIWEDLAEQNDSRALESLAKYHEHISRDLCAAQRCAGALPEGSARRRRQARIRRKRSGNLPLPLG